MLKVIVGAVTAVSAGIGAVLGNTLIITLGNRWQARHAPDEDLADNVVDFVRPRLPRNDR